MPYCPHDILVEGAAVSIVEADRPVSVLRRTWGDEQVFAQEMDLIFKHAWQFLAHESEIPEPGDYVQRRMGRDRVIVVRSEDGVVRVFLNTCRHRGVPLCRADEGNSSHFRCSYHGWTYANTGELRGVTYQPDVYGREGLDKSEFGLYSPAQVDSYQGLVFANWDADAVSLPEYLGDLTWYLDAIMGKFDAGMEVVGTPVRNIVKANWKTEGENLSGDGYHTMVTHATAVELGLFATPGDLEKLTDTLTPRFTGRTADLGHGHTIRVQRLPVVVDGTKYWGYPEDMWPEFDRNLSPQQQEVMSALSVCHGSVFPNMSFIENFKTNVDGPGLHARYFRVTIRYPLSATHSEQVWFLLQPRGADPTWRRLSSLAYLRTNGPSGMFELDDTENFVGISEASAGDVARDTAVTYRGGLHHEPTPADVGWPGDVVDGDRTEKTLRAFHRQWARMMGDEGVVSE
jgi:phenylpropionate dioxygenase-like ring-hydroxylating dioxygenase large terminal subunit